VKLEDRLRAMEQRMKKRLEDHQAGPDRFEKLPPDEQAELLEIVLKSDRLPERERIQFQSYLDYLKDKDTLR